MPATCTYRRPAAAAFTPACTATPPPLPRSPFFPCRPHVLRHQADEPVHQPPVGLLRILGREVEVAAHKGDLADLLGGPGTGAPHGAARLRRKQAHREL